MAEKKICPNCLSDMVAESIGWKCENCLAFLDMKGVLHEHKEKPFMPPMTNADRIRAMSDEELAKEMLFFCPTDTVFKGEDAYGKPHYTGLDGGYYATSEEVVASNLDWLKQPAGVTE